MNMKKNIIIISLLLLLILSSCKKISRYEETEGYQEYISDCNTGYNDVPYYYVQDSMSESILARKYFKENSRRSGDFLITDYMDGVCINKYCGLLFGDDLIIPEEIDGKPVVKLGGYFEGDIEAEDSYSGKEIIGAFGGNVNVTLHIPSSVKIITQESISFGRGMISDKDKYKYVYIKEFDVDKDNLYYSSSEYGNLYTKDMETLLYFQNYDEFESEYKTEGITIIVPNYIQNFAPSNGIATDLRYKFGKSIKKIDTYIDMGESDSSQIDSIYNNVVIYGYKDTVAEKWAKEQHAKFESIKD